MRLTRASAQRWRSRCLMRSKEAFASSRSTGCFCSVATDHPAPCRRVTLRRAGACHDATGMERHDKNGLLGWWRAAENRCEVELQMPKESVGQFTQQALRFGFLARQFPTPDAVSSKAGPNRSYA